MMTDAEIYAEFDAPAPPNLRALLDVAESYHSGEHSACSFAAEMVEQCLKKAEILALVHLSDGMAVDERIRWLRENG